MPNTIAGYYQRVLNELNSVYKRGGFNLTKIRCDNEFHAALDRIVAAYDPPITVNHANPQEHFPQAERKNQYIKERFCAVYHRLPFDRLPREMVKYMGLEWDRKPNMFPANHGVLKYYSPRMIICQENLDYEKHLRIPFGDYVLSKNEPNPTNKNKPRRLDCIYLQAKDRAQGCHDILRLQTNPLITRNHVTPAPITPTIINQVQSIDDMECMLSGIKIANITGLILYDIAWIARVDY